MHKTDLKLKDYNRKPVGIVGVIKVQVECGDQSKELPLVVVQGERDPLFGRNWLRDIKLDWQRIFAPRIQVVSTTVDTLEEIFDCNKEVFGSDLGCLKDFV